MASLELSHLTKRFGDFTAVHDLNLAVAEGEMVALLGGSGCGKTTTLRMIAGFTEATEGRVLVDGKDIGNLPAYKRNVGIFFQNYALFPHMTTYDNVAFGLKLKKLPRPEIEKKVSTILGLVRLSGLERRYPRELSGGQQQRVALARALVTEPSVLLLDEPLSNLDAKLRVEMQLEIKRIQRETGITTIIVTHDQEEAISLADRVIVMNAGRLLQVGTPREVFERPANLFVADFMGISNFIPAVVGEGDFLLTDTGRLPIPPAERARFAQGEAVRAAIRPELVRVQRASAPGLIAGTVESAVYKGNATRLEIGGVFDSLLYASLHDDASFERGMQVFVGLPADKLLIYHDNEKEIEP